MIDHLVEFHDNCLAAAELPHSHVAQRRPKGSEPLGGLAAHYLYYRGHTHSVAHPKEEHVPPESCVWRHEYHGHIRPGLAYARAEVGYLSQRPLSETYRRAGSFIGSMHPGVIG